MAKQSREEIQAELNRGINLTHERHVTIRTGIIAASIVAVSIVIGVVLIKIYAQQSLKHLQSQGVMTMSGELIFLFFCSSTLALLGGYAFWIPVRVLRLKVDQIEIFLKTRAVIYQSGYQHDPAFLNFQKRMDRQIQNARISSLPVLIYLMLKISANEADYRNPVSEISSANADLTTLLQSAENECWSREIRSVFQGTISGWAALFLVRSMAHLSNDELKRGIEALVNPGDRLQPT